jgi:hypothetical protein
MNRSREAREEENVLRFLRLAITPSVKNRKTVFFNLRSTMAGFLDRVLPNKKCRHIVLLFAVFACFCSKFFSGFLHFLISGEVFLSR